jgi:bile acid:Na+ symporter, BASS family
MPDSFVAFVNTMFVPVGLMLIMFSLGLTLALRDFALLLTNAKTVFAGLAGQLVVMPLLALAIGLLFRLPPPLALGLFILAIWVAISLDMVMLNLLRGGPAIWTLNVAAMAAGLLIGRLIGAEPRDRMTLAIEVGVHNVTLAIFLTLTVLDNLPLAVLQNIYGVVMLLNASLLIRGFRRLIRAGEAA